MPFVKVSGHFSTTVRRTAPLLSGAAACFHVSELYFGSVPLFLHPAHAREFVAVCGALVHAHDVAGCVFFFLSGTVHMNAA